MENIELGQRGGRSAARQVTEPAQGGANAAASYRIALAACSVCKKAVRIGGAEDVAVEPHVLDAAMCNAEVVSIEGEPARATRTIPPRIQRHVLLRHHNRCAVPGCCNSLVDLHHLDEWAEGGAHDPDRMLPLCGAHHDAAHRKVLVIRGDAKRGFVFEHADGRAYGSVLVDPRLAQTLATVEGMLCSMGFESREARVLVDAIRGKVAVDASTDEVLYAAVCHGRTPRTAAAALAS